MKKKKNNPVGKAVMQFRKDHDMTLSEMADFVSISAPHLSLIEQGQTTVTIRTLNKLRHVLGLRGDDLSRDEYMVIRAWRENDIARLLQMISVKIRQESNNHDG